MAYPNQQLWAGWSLKMSSAHDAMSAAGCRSGVSYDLETPLYFGLKNFVEAPTRKRSDAFDLVAQECRAVREKVGLLDIFGFSRFEVSGLNTPAWLERLMASKLPTPERVRLAPILSPEGRPKGDLTVFNWGWHLMDDGYCRVFTLWPSRKRGYCPRWRRRH